MTYSKGRIPDAQGTYEGLFCLLGTLHASMLALEQGSSFEDVRAYQKAKRAIDSIARTFCIPDTSRMTFSTSEKSQPSPLTGREFIRALGTLPIFGITLDSKYSNQIMALFEVASEVFIRYRAIDPSFNSLVWRYPFCNLTLAEIIEGKRNAELN
ncbi:MAG TPA: hypothetical protein VJJ82_01110 [Candidatus Nanoarchaeia archaeon]|nr:hypothetical protein [Candidatus Nanoarchaeia archaeon]